MTIAARHGATAIATAIIGTVIIGIFQDEIEALREYICDWMVDYF